MGHSLRACEGAGLRKGIPILKIRNLADYTAASEAEKVAYQKQAVSEVLDGVKRREIVKRYDIDARTLCLWVSLHRSTLSKVGSTTQKRQKPSDAKKLRTKEWKDKRAKAVAAVKGGGKIKDVAKRFGVSRQAIDLWLKDSVSKKRGHGLQRLTEVERQKVRRKVVAKVLGGSTQAAAAREFDVSELSVGRWMKQYEQGGFGALGENRRKRPDEVEVEYFRVRFAVDERPTKMSQIEGRRLAEDYVGKTVACEKREHKVVSAYFDPTLGIVLSYVHAPIDKDALE